MRIPFALLCVTLATPAAAQQVDTRADAAVKAAFPTAPHRRRDDAAVLGKP